jgi:hypothetical protein
MVVSMVYYGLILNSSNLGGDIYFNFVMASLVEIPTLILVILLINKTGRIRLNSACRVFGGVACVSTTFTVLYGGDCKYELRS